MADYLVQPNRIERPTAVENAQNVMANSTIIEQGQQNVRTNQLRNVLSPIFSDPNLSTDQKLKAITAKTGEFDQSAGLALMQAEQKQQQAMEQKAMEYQVDTLSKLATSFIQNHNQAGLDSLADYVNTNPKLASVVGPLGSKIPLGKDLTLFKSEGIDPVDGKNKIYFSSVDKTTAKEEASSFGAEVAKKEPTTKINIGGESSSDATTKDLPDDYIKALSPTEVGTKTPVPSAIPANTVVAKNGKPVYVYNAIPKEAQKTMVEAYVAYSAQKAIAEQMVKNNINPDILSNAPVIGGLYVKLAKDDKFNRWYTQAFAETNRLIKSFGGTAVSKGEFERIIKAIPNTAANTKGQYIENLNGYVDGLRSNSNAIFDQYAGKEGFMPVDNQLRIPEEDLTLQSLKAKQTSKGKIGSSKESPAPYVQGFKDGWAKNAKGEIAFFKNGVPQ